MAAVSMVLTPLSRAARMAAIESASSVPPHIHPPMAQAPKTTGVTLTSDVPSWRNCIATPSVFLQSSSRDGGTVGRPGRAWPSGNTGETNHEGARRSTKEEKKGFVREGTRRDAKEEAESDQ